MPLPKEKKKLTKLIQQSDSDDSDHELSYYLNDRVKLMKEVLKTIKPKRIKAMAPSCIRDFDLEEINSMLLEELLGISNKRLKYIFNGQNIDEESSSSTNEDEQIDVISLDDISDDEFVINLDDDHNEKGSKMKKVKREHKHKVKEEGVTVKKEKQCRRKQRQNHTSENQSDGGIDSNKNLMSVLELLELQARARAIKSQLLLENAKTQESISIAQSSTMEEKIGSDDDVLIETTKMEEIIITSSDSEIESKHHHRKRKTIEIAKMILNPSQSTSKGKDEVSSSTNAQKNDTEPSQDTKENREKEKTYTIKKNGEDEFEGVQQNEAVIVNDNKMETIVDRQNVKIRIIENQEISQAKDNAEITAFAKTVVDSCDVIGVSESVEEQNSEVTITATIDKQKYNEESIVINLSDDEIDYLR